jgi:hypothetical protein
MTLYNMDGCPVEYLGRVNLSDYMLCPSTIQNSQTPSPKNEKRWYGKSLDGKPLKELKRYEQCSPSQLRQTDLQSSDGQKGKPKTDNSRRKSNRVLARIVAKGSHWRDTTSKQEGTEKPAMIQQTGSESASPVTTTCIPSQQKNSSQSTSGLHCVHCGSLFLRRRGRWDYCPKCTLYQPID